MPSLIASQVLPLMGPPVATTDAVTVLAPALTDTSPTAQRILLTDTISGSPKGGTVNFTVAGVGSVNNVPVVNGVAQVVYTIPVGTPSSTAGTVTATYSGTTGFAASTSSGVGNGTLTFCADGASTLLGTTLQSFAVLAGSTVTNVGPTVIDGNVGVSPGSAVTGFPPGIVNAPSTIHINDGPANLAQTQLTTAYTTILSETVGFTNLTGQDLGGLTLTPGRYHFDNSAQLTGTLTLNDQNNPAARFDFQIGSSLTTASASRILFINGGADNVYWQVGTSATLGSSTVFAGNILANASISLNNTASIACGRALARTGAVTMINNFIDPTPNGPRILIPAAAKKVTGQTTLLSVTAIDSNVAKTLTYNWSVLSAPTGAAAPTFSSNGTATARNTTVTFHAAGTYRFRVTVTDTDGLTTTSDLTVVVTASF